MSPSWSPVDVPPLDAASLAELDARARDAMKRAYAPYSGFAVGAVIATAEGAHVGVNVENAAYGSTLCAERNAIGAMVAAGDRSGVVGIAIAGRGQDPLTPCGACRQVLAEFCGPTTPIRGQGDNAGAVWLLADLLPEAFGPVRLAAGRMHDSQQAAAGRRDG